MADDNTRGVQLNEKQLVFVLMAAGVICGVMFLVGVMVGRNVQLARGSGAEGTMISSPQVVSDPQPGADAAAKPAGAAGDEFSYPSRLTQAGQPVEQLKPAGAASAAAPAGGPPGSQAGQAPAGVAAPPEVPDEASTVKTPAAAEAGGRETAPPSPKNANGAAPKAGAAVPKANEPVPAPTAAKPAENVTDGPWTVQVMATKKRSEADAAAKRLRAKGYEVRVVVPEPDDKSGVFRVKVGSYKSRTEAEAVAVRIKGEGPYPTWVTR